LNYSYSDPAGSLDLARFLDSDTLGGVEGIVTII